MNLLQLYLLIKKVRPFVKYISFLICNLTFEYISPIYSILNDLFGRYRIFLFPNMDILLALRNFFDRVTLKFKLLYKYYLNIKYLYLVF